MIIKLPIIVLPAVWFIAGIYDCLCDQRVIYGRYEGDDPHFVDERPFGSRVTLWSYGWFGWMLEIKKNNN